MLSKTASSPAVAYDSPDTENSLSRRFLSNTQTLVVEFLCEH